MATRTNDLTEFAKSIADNMAMRCGTLKVALSAGIIALSKLSAEDRERAIAEANGQQADIEKPTESVQKPVTLRDAIKKIVRKTKAEQELPAMRIKITSTDESLWAALKPMVDAEPEKKRKAKRG